MKIYHIGAYELGGGPTSLCGERYPDDVLLTFEEIEDPQGPHFNCVDCHKELSGGHKHVPPPEGWDDGSD